MYFLFCQAIVQYVHRFAIGGQFDLIRLLPVWIFPIKFEIKWLPFKSKYRRCHMSDIQYAQEHLDFSILFFFQYKILVQPADLP